MKVIQFVLIVMLSIFASSKAFSQLQKIPLSLKIEQSSTIFEGKVVLSQSYEDNGKVYTAHLIEVYQILKKIMK